MHYLAEWRRFVGKATGKRLSQERLALLSEITQKTVSVCERRRSGNRATLRALEHGLRVALREGEQPEVEVDLRELPPCA